MHFLDIGLDLGSSETRQVCEFRSIALDSPSSVPSTRFGPFPTKNRFKRYRVAGTFKRKVGQRKPELGSDMGPLGGNRERGHGHRLHATTSNHTSRANNVDE